MRLFVGNLAFSTTDKEIMAHFQGQGFKPVAVKLVTDRETGRSRGFCFVDLPSDTEGNKAIQSLNGSEISGRRLKITPAEDKRNGPTNTRQVSSNVQNKPYTPIRTYEPPPQRVYNEEPAPYTDPSYYQLLEQQEVGKERSRRKDRSRKKNRKEYDEDDDW